MSTLIKIFHAESNILVFPWYAFAIEKLLKATKPVKKNKKQDIATLLYWTLTKPFLTGPSKVIGKSPKALVKTKKGFATVKIFSMLKV